MRARVLLASTSPYRRGLLSRLPLDFDVVAPRVDEAAAQARVVDPAELVRELGVAKARAVAELYPGAIVVGSDQCVSIGGAIVGKPGTRDRAIEQLVQLSGRTHQLWTSVAVVLGEREEVEVDCHRLTMRALERDALERYVELDRPFDCAGAYKIESAGVGLFERIEGEDFTAIVGLPLTRLVRMLGRFGLEVFA